jgi:Fe-S-cluster-containing dehydrogenase component
MKKWNLVIDVAKCFNCNLCAIACHDEYFGNEFPGYAAEMPRLGHRWIDILQKERGKYPTVDVVYLPVTCNHCDDAPCMKAAQNGAVTKRADGIVVIVPEKAKGQRQLVDSCPYGAIWWNEEKQLPQAWPFDAHLLDQGWKKTRGSQVCPTEAMKTYYLEDAEMQQLAAQEKLEVLKPELGTKPRVYYKNLDRWRKVFVGGSLSGAIGGTVECVSGAKVVLKRGGGKIAEAITNTFGDFRFDGLEENSGSYSIEIDAPNFPRKVVEFAVAETVCLGTVELGK